MAKKTTQSQIRACSGSSKMETSGGNKCPAMKKNVLLCVDVKTYLLHDPMPVAGRGYKGHLSLQSDDMVCFVEEASKPPKRNPCIYRGRWVNLHLTPDGRVYPTFCRPEAKAGHAAAGELMDAAGELRALAESMIFGNGPVGM